MTFKMAAPAQIHVSPLAAPLRRTWTSAISLTLLAAAACVPSQPAIAAPSKVSERLPARLLVCVLGHATNFDPEKSQTLGDIKYDTHHRLTLFLPAIDQRSAPPPDAMDNAEAVNRQTRVVEDPDGITAEAPGLFDRVVDLWPDRVELAKSTATGPYKTFLVSDYDPAAGTARMFIGTASDITTYDLKRIYMGECTVTLNPQRRAKTK